MAKFQAEVEVGQGSTAFFEKKEAKKLFSIWSDRVKAPRTKSIKVFCFFFSKKKSSPSPSLPSRAPEAGFTLIEVLVAFIIAALALMVLFEGSVGGLKSTKVATHYEEALSRARSHMAGLLAQTGFHAGRQTGKDGAGFRWRTQVTPMGMATISGKHRTRPALYGLRVTISWHKDGGRRSVTLHSERLGSITPGSS